MGVRLAPCGGAIEGLPAPAKSEVFPKNGGSITGKTLQGKITGFRGGLISRTKGGPISRQNGGLGGSDCTWITFLSTGLGACRFLDAPARHRPAHSPAPSRSPRSSICTTARLITAARLCPNCPASPSTRSSKGSAMVSVICTLRPLRTRRGTWEVPTSASGAPEINASAASVLAGLAGLEGFLVIAIHQISSEITCF